MEGAGESLLEKKKRTASLTDYVMNTEGKLGGNPFMIKLYLTND